MAPDVQPVRWFGRKEDGRGFAILTWQGKAATFLYVFLVVVAVFIYSTLTLLVVVVLFYTVVFVFLVALKSDFLQDWPPGRGDGSGNDGNPHP